MTMTTQPEGEHETCDPRSDRRPDEAAPGPACTDDDGAAASVSNTDIEPCSFGETAMEAGTDYIPWLQLDEWGETPLGRLVCIMSDFSEEYICAGWLDGCEHALWELANRPGRWGHPPWHVDISEADAARMLALSAEIGGWPAAGESGVVLVPLAEWLVRHEADLQRRAKFGQDTAPAVGDDPGA